MEMCAGKTNMIVLDFDERLHPREYWSNVAIT
jgi:hypothetical protein